MREKKDKKTTNDIYLLASGARGYNDEFSINKLKYYAIGTGDERALIELLDIAPNLYFENKAVQKCVDSAIKRGENSGGELLDSGSFWHLKALKEYADATETTSFIGVNKNKSNDFINRSVANRNVALSLVSIFTEDISKLESTNPTDPHLKTKYSLLEDAKNEVQKYSSIAHLLDKVNNAFKKARNAYLEEAKSSGLEDAQICKAKAHLINKNFNFGLENKGDYSLISLTIASKINPSVEKDYYLAQCLAYDSKISESDYLRSLMRINYNGGKDSVGTTWAIETGKDLEKFEDAEPRLLFLDPNLSDNMPDNPNNEAPKLLDPNEPIDYPSNPHFFNGEFKSYSPSPIFGGDND